MSTDQFELYPVRPGSGVLAASDCNEAMQSVPVDITADTTIAVDLTQMITGCA